MDTEIRNKIDRIWEYFWTGGITNPLSVIEQITYLLFIKGLDDIEIKKEKDLTVFVNTLSMDVGFAVSDPERALILNIKKGDKETYKVEVSFSKDIDVDDYQDDINTTLTDAAPLLERKEYGKYILTVLDGASSVLQEVNIEALNQMTMTKEQENGSSTPIMIAAFVIIILFIVYKMYAAYKDKSNQEEDD